MAINATAVWRVRPSGSNTACSGGYDASISGAATDYSQQNAAQASGTHGTASGTTTFTDATAANFTSAMVGNAIQIVSGAGFTAGFYFVTAFTSSSVVTLDRSPGTGTVAVWHLGGAWADFWTNSSSSGPLVPGNTVYILGSGIPNPASYTYDYTNAGGVQFVSGSSSAGFITYAGDPNTPNYATGGKPCVSCFNSGSSEIRLFWAGSYLKMLNVWLVAAGTDQGGIFYAATNVVISGCVFDQFNYDMGLLGNGVNGAVIGNEIFNSKTTTAGSTYAINGSSFQGGEIAFNNVHDCISNGIYTGSVQRGVCHHNVIAKCGGVGIYLNGGGGGSLLCAVFNNTIDGNKGNGIEFDGQTSLATTVCYNNIISNHTQSGKFGLTVDAGTTAANNLVASFCDYNTFYNNTTNYNAYGGGAHDTVLGTNPYVGQSTENYTLA